MPGFFVQGTPHRNINHPILYTMQTPAFQTPPPSTTFTRLAYPAPHVLLVTLSRPRQLNCINAAGNHELHQVWAWMDGEPSLRIAIITGEGRAFCAGADLKGLPHLSTPTSAAHVHQNGTKRNLPFPNPIAHSTLQASAVSLAVAARSPSLQPSTASPMAVAAR